MNGRAKSDATSSWLARFRNWTPGRLAQNTALATFWQGVRLALQMVYLVLVARILGAENYGVFSGIIALAASLSPLVGWGFGTILVKKVSRTPNSFPIYWAKALRAVVFSAPIMAGAMFLLAHVLLPEESHWIVVALIAAAELAAMPLVAAGSLAFLAHEQLGRMVFNHVQLNLTRLAAVAILIALGHDSLIEFAWAYFGATTFAAVLSFIQVNRIFGRPDWQYCEIAGQMREGIGFSLSVVANSAHGEIDKTLLLRLGTSAATGNYSLASRIVSAATTPLVSYVLALVPRLFREGEMGIVVTTGIARRLLLPILLYGALVGTGLVLFAPLLPWVFGPSFAASLSLVYWLAPVPLLIGTSQLGLNILSASGHQRIRVMVESTAFVFNVILNLFLIPARGGEGAAMAMLSSQVLLVVLPVISIHRLAQNNNPCSGKRND